MFKGFTDDTLNFLTAIRFNNNREFFHDNHDWYVQSLRQPLLDLAADLGEAIEQIDPEIEHRPERAVSRINRDLRFSKDKSPYRDWMWIGFHHPANKHGFPSFYMDISAERMGYGMGFWEDNRPMTDAHRLYLENHAEEFLSTVVPACEGMGVQIKAYKKLPLPENLPGELNDWYRLRSLFIYTETNDMGFILNKDAGEVIKREFLKLTPVYRYFAGLKPVEI